MNPSIIKKTKIQKENFAKVESQLLDDYWSAILILLWRGREMRFNEIYRALKIKGIKLSKPTLSEHLKHLQKKKWITRKANGTQNVSYKLHKSLNVPSQDENENWLEKTQNSLNIKIIEPSPEEKVDLALTNIFLSKLKELYLRIEIEPKIQRQSLSFGVSQSRTYENSLINECNKDEKYRQIILDKTKELLKFLSERRSNVLNRIFDDEIC